MINPILNFFPREKSEEMIPGFLQRAPATWRAFAGLLSAKGGKFFGGAAPHIGDFHVFHYLDNLCTLDGGVTLRTLGDEQTASLQAWRAEMQSLPGVQEYLGSRPQPGTGAVGRPGSIMATVEVPADMPIVKEALMA